ncbi:MAG: hypothetical protein ABI783_09125 [Actinomycetota bacterium]
MPRYFLYYAGMAADNENEQIGLAVSDDGLQFERVGDDGLIMRRVPESPWRRLRVCNPTVLHEDGRFLMFYQGIEPGTLHTSIGVATSNDGIHWDPDLEPAIPWQRMIALDPDLDPDQRVALIEPAVIREGDTYSMWFVYSHGERPTNSLWHAKSSDGRRWEIQPQRILSGGQFGQYRLHYPQVVRGDDGYELFFTLRNRRNGVDGVFAMTSRDGAAWDDLRQLLPSVPDAISLQPRQFMNVSVAWEPAARLLRKGFGSLNRALVRRLHDGANGLGWAHPHVINVGTARRLYYHSSNLAGRGDRWADVGCCERADGACAGHRTVFRRGRPGAWDEQFVADPYVLVVP